MEIKALLQPIRYFVHAGYFCDRDHPLQPLQVTNKHYNQWLKAYREKILTNNSRLKKCMIAVKISLLLHM